MMCFIAGRFFGICRMVAMLWLVFALTQIPQSSFAAQSDGLVVTPLGDGGNGVAQGGEAVEGDTSLSSQSGSAEPSSPAFGDGSPAGNRDTGVSADATIQLSDEPPSYKDGIVMAYLVELMRKQGKPCPSGSMPQIPPSLLFSEPLCRVAEAVGGGEDFPSAFESQGLYALRWRMFSATDQPAQVVATQLRAEHCEALLEPHTHIGAWHSLEGWRIVLATLTDKPPVPPAAEPQAVTPDGGAAVPESPGPSAPAQAMPIPAPAAVPGPAPAEKKLPAAPGPSLEYAVPTSAPRPDLPSLAEMRAESTAPSAQKTPVAASSLPQETFFAEPKPDSAPTPAMPDDAMFSREAQALFRLMNELRVNGGVCSGKPVQTAPPLVVHPSLQAAAEREAGEAAARGSFGIMLGVSPDIDGASVNYSGVKVSKLTGSSRPSAPVMLDVWKVNPTRCNMLLSSEYTDVGTAYVDGYWVVLMGQRGM